MTPPLDPAHFEIFTTAEAAAILKVKESWLEKRAAARQIPFTMLGGGYRFSSQHIQQIICAFEVSPPPVDASTIQPAPAVGRRRREPVDTPDPRVVPLRPRTPRSRHRNELAA